MMLEYNATKIPAFQKLESTLAEISEQLFGCDKNLSSLRQQLEMEQQQIAPGLAQRKNELLDYQRKLARYYDDASKYASPMAADEAPEEYNNLLLLRLFSRLTDRSCSENERRNIAHQMLQKIAAYRKWLTRELHSCEQSIACEREQRVGSCKSQIAKIEQQKNACIAQFDAALKEISLLSYYDKIHQEFETLSAGVQPWGASVNQKEFMLLGYYHQAVNVYTALNNSLKKHLGDHYNHHAQTIESAAGIRIHSGVMISVEYTVRNADKMARGVRMLLANLLKYYELGTYRINLIDTVHYNNSLLEKFSACEAKANSIFESTPTSETEISNTLSILAEYYRGIEQKIGTDTVETYNAHRSADKIPMRVLILNRTKQYGGIGKDEDIVYLMNNAEKLGIVLIVLERHSADGSYGTNDETRIMPKTEKQVQIISGKDGTFYVEREPSNAARFAEFRWFDAPELTPDYLEWVRGALKPQEVETRYFERYPFKGLPPRSVGKRRPIILPFAIDGENEVKNCEFEDDQFAAYMMGASGSGKSTLLHTLISGLLTNYHPDEIELWLVDYKMTEFIPYIDNRPPHVRYVLLENTEDLTFDIIDRLTETLNRRKYIFSKNKWQKLTDVPPEIYMPAIFVIIDEFSIMSQIIQATRGMVPDYTLRLQNLLAQGRALGFKFLFASQTYSEGVGGLTETAKKQIQMRFALKNTSDEITQTLALMSAELSPSLRRDIISLPKYESLFKYRNADGELQIGRLKNMYTTRAEVEHLLKTLSTKMRCIQKEATASSNSYYDKESVLIDGGTPKTYQSQHDMYLACDHGDEMEDDVPIYPGVPCSFQLTNHFSLCNQFDENVLLIGGKDETQAAILMSVIKTYQFSQGACEIWAHKRSKIYRKYASQLPKTITDPIEIARRIHEIHEDVINGKDSARLIVVLGYESLMHEMERIRELQLSNRNPQTTYVSQVQKATPGEAVDNCNQRDRLLEEMFTTQDPKRREELSKAIATFNKRPEQQLVHDVAAQPTVNKLHDSNVEMNALLKLGSQYGVHVMLCFTNASDFLRLRMMKARMFRHKLLFTIPRDAALDLTGNRLAAEVAEDVCLYCGDTHRYTMRPHLHPNIPINGWTISSTGSLVQEYE